MKPAAVLTGLLMLAPGTALGQPPATRPPPPPMPQKVTPCSTLKVIKRVAPSFTEAMQSAATGPVTLIVTITPGGVPSDVMVHFSSGSPDADAQAAKTAQDWRWEPFAPGCETARTFVRFTVQQP